MIDAVTAEPDLLGENPLWDDRISRLYRIDIDGRLVHRLDPSAGTVETRRCDGRPGSIALTADPNRLLVAVEDRITHLDWTTGSVEPWLELDTGGPHNRLNDGACDRDGRFWVGSMHEDATESSGLLHRVGADGSVLTTRSGIGVANGIAFSPDGSTMYFADSVASIVWAYDYADGMATNERVLNSFSDLPGIPDGATVDESGGYWVACVFGSAVARLTPDGDIDRIIDLPLAKPTKPAFGGPGLATMFVTSIGGGGSHRRPDPPGTNGLVLALDVGVRGLPEPIFAGSMSA